MSFTRHFPKMDGTTPSSPRQDVALLVQAPFQVPVKFRPALPSAITGTAAMLDANIVAEEISLAPISVEHRCTPLHALEISLGPEGAAEEA